MNSAFRLPQNGKLDQIMYLTSRFVKDTSPKKINGVIGSYRNSNGSPYLFESVAGAMNILNSKKKPFEYLPITGDSEYLDLSKKLYFGSDTNFDNVQTLSGTGALSLAGSLLVDAMPDKKLYLPDPTWANHHNIFSYAGVKEIDKYSYILPHSRKFDIEYMMESIKSLDNNNAILLHACAHNPTGYDLTPDQWTEIYQLCRAKNLLPVLDCAYLGFASGNLDADGIACTKLNEFGDILALVCTSYSKNFGLYSKRVGNLFFRGETKLVNDAIKSRLGQMIRSTYSNPPSSGSDIIKTILSEPYIYETWKEELVKINEHYRYIRSSLRKELEDKLNEDYSSITDQCGMFYYGEGEITPKQAQYLRDKKSIYILDNGRTSIAGLNEGNMSYFVESLCESKYAI